MNHEVQFWEHRQYTSPSHQNVKYKVYEFLKSFMIPPHQYSFIIYNHNFSNGKRIICRKIYI